VVVGGIRRRWFFVVVLVEFDLFSPVALGRGLRGEAGRNSIQHDPFLIGAVFFFMLC